MPLYAPRSACYTARVFRRSSAVEQLTVNQLVVGSIPTAGAKILRTLATCRSLMVGFEAVPPSKRQRADGPFGRLGELFF
jgi:hypothetical protein